MDEQVHCDRDGRQYVKMGAANKNRDQNTKLRTQLNPWSAKDLISSAPYLSNRPTITTKTAKKIPYKFEYSDGSDVKTCYVIPVTERMTEHLVDQSGVERPLITEQIAQKAMWINDFIYEI